ncbi:MAG: Hypothetical protein BHV28_10530 [Candidatus Tokpelaia hoelldobleri]|uniref:AI-2E family transporter n=1 Tax=Candidatus Tokpelaia hoelldobleri TaxID=1902579 RepID=A0A1U9JV57_9HYPH|nr:MAG: Hypothetical protein BHV28_10530 [Candidatus Tokpelaia hoelldoblerii]
MARKKQQDLPRVAKSKPALKRAVRRQPVAFAALPVNSNMRRQAVFWLVALALFILFLVLFSDILFPFVAGLTLAYFLNPVVEFLDRVGFSRLWATVMIMLAALVLLALALVLLVPVLSEQLLGFIKNVPGYFSRLRVWIAAKDWQWLHDYIGIDLADLASWQNSLDSLPAQMKTVMDSLLPGLWNSGKALMNMVTLFIVAPVVTFYMLLDWDRMVVSVDSWIPRAHLATVRSIFHQMDRAIAGFIRGQGTVCLILGVYYAVMLSSVGLNFGLLLGLVIGFLTFIPYIGTAIGFVLTLSLAWMQFWPDSWSLIVAIVVIFAIGQFTEGYVLQPKLVGHSVGLHPVWLMFALFAFGSLFGFTGMLIAVPAAAAVGVLVRFALHTYLASPMYGVHSDRQGKAK